MTDQIWWFSVVGLSCCWHEAGAQGGRGDQGAQGTTRSTGS